MKKQLLESYLNGNIRQTREDLGEMDFRLGDLLEYYLETMDPDKMEIVFFVKALSTN